MPTSQTTSQRSDQIMRHSRENWGEEHSFGMGRGTIFSTQWSTEHGTRFRFFITTSDGTVGPMTSGQTIRKIDSILRS